MYLCGDILHFSLHYNVKWFISTNLNRQVTDCYIIHNPAHLTLEQGWTIIFFHRVTWETENTVEGRAKNLNSVSIVCISFLYGVYMHIVFK